MRHLTLASKTQQREWLALVDCPEKHAPTGTSLRAWLFGGSAIAAKVAMFDLADYTGEIVSDLFGEDSYFADADAFRSEEHTSELQSLMRISYAVFCLKKKTTTKYKTRDQLSTSLSEV